MEVVYQGGDEGGVGAMLISAGADEPPYWLPPGAAGQVLTMVDPGDGIVVPTWVQL